MVGEIIKVSDFTMEPVPRSAIQSFVERWHYSHSTNGVQQTQCFALFDDMKMIGAMIYALPSMKSTAAKYNPDNPDRCWELRRLCCIDDIYKLPVQDIADENCVLMMWVTYPLLKEGIKTMEEWGFTYKKTLCICRCIIYTTQSS